MEEIAVARVHKFAFVIAAFSCVVLSGFWAVDSYAVKNEFDTVEIETRINPNYAESASLMRLPGIDLSRAEAIVAYRSSSEDSASDKIAFNNCNDMQKVKGIGPKTADKICQWLKFD